MELSSHMPTLFRGVLWSASFMRLRFFGSCPWLYRGLLPGASLRMPTLSWGVQWSACLSGLRCATLVLQLLPFCDMEGFFLELLLRMPVFISGHLVGCLFTWPPSCDFLLPLFLFWAFSWVIIGLIPLLSVLQCVGAFFWMRFL